MSRVRLVGGPKDGAVVEVDDPGDVVRVWETSGGTVTVVPFGPEVPVGRATVSYLRTDRVTDGVVDDVWDPPRRVPGAGTPRQVIP